MINNINNLYSKHKIFFDFEMSVIRVEDLCCLSRVAWNEVLALVLASKGCVKSKLLRNWSIKQTYGYLKNLIV